MFHPKAVADDSGVHTTLKTPVYHRPKDECGGGSAWACGILDVFMNKGLPSSSGKAQTPTHLQAMGAITTPDPTPTLN